MNDYVDKIYICDPHRNKLLSEGAKADKIDASKLVQLLKAGLMKEVYHSTEKFLYLRRLVSAYEDLVKSGVRIQNQCYSFLMACGNSGYENQNIKLSSIEEQFVLECLDRQIEAYKKEKDSYEKIFEKLAKKYPEIKHQKSLLGIGTINAVKIVSRIVSSHRFSDNGNYLSYTGLIKHEKISGGGSYGKKPPRFCRQLKNVYKSGVLSTIGRTNPINDYYEYLIREKCYSEHNARHKACRKLAILSLGVFKSGNKYQPYRQRMLSGCN